MAKDSIEDLDWLKFKQEIGSTELKSETGFQKLSRKFSENPFVPIGALLTSAALSYGLVSFKRGEVKMSQMMMRARIVAQAFTVVALCGGVLFASTKTTKTNET